jgi:hypothetical protein
MAAMYALVWSEDRARGAAAVGAVGDSYRGAVATRAGFDGLYWFSSRLVSAGSWNPLQLGQ